MFGENGRLYLEEHCSRAKCTCEIERVLARTVENWHSRHGQSRDSSSTVREGAKIK
jgi:hypothetical protein